jgi:hypothetical protein
MIHHMSHLKDAVKGIGWYTHHTYSSTQVYAIGTLPVSLIRKPSL